MPPPTQGHWIFARQVQHIKMHYDPNGNTQVVEGCS